MAAGLCVDIEKLQLQVRELALRFADVGHEDVGAVIGAMQGLENILHETRRRLWATLSRSDVWADLGFRTPARYLAVQSGLSNGAARTLHRHARVMADLRHASDAATEGLLNDIHIEQLVKCKVHGGDRYTDDVDEAFTNMAATGDLEAFAEVVRSWHAHLDALDGPDPTERTDPAIRESLHLSQSFDGWWHGTVTLSPANGALLNSALERGTAHYLRAKRDDDPSVQALEPPAMRAQALTDLVAAAMRRPAGSTSVADRYHIALTIHTDEDGNPEPDAPTSSPLPPEATCIASFYRLVLGAAGEPLDIGRSTNRWPAPLARAIHHRDRHCRFPGCEQPTSRCDIHHCHTWHDGGPTSIDNGTSLCRYHHTWIHTKGWTVRLDGDHHPTFHRRDGTEHDPPDHRPRREES